MAKYGKYDTLDELIGSYKPMMQKDKEEQEKRLQSGEMEPRRRKRNYDTDDEMMVLLYALEHMEDQELDELEAQCKVDLEEIQARKEQK